MAIYAAVVTIAAGVVFGLVGTYLPTILFSVPGTPQLRRSGLVWGIISGVLGCIVILLKLDPLTQFSVQQWDGTLGRLITLPSFFVAPVAVGFTFGSVIGAFLVGIPRMMTHILSDGRRPEQPADLEERPLVRFLRNSRDRSEAVRKRREVKYHQVRAHGYLLRGKHDQAEKELKLALELDPSSEEAHRVLGDLYIAIGRQEEAREQYAAVAELMLDSIQDTHSAKYHRYLGGTHLYHGDYPQAEVELKLAIKIDPLMGEAYADLGHLYQETGDLPKAREYLKTAIDVMLEAGQNHAAHRVAALLNEVESSSQSDRSV